MKRLLQYIKDNSRIITKLILNQVGGAVLGITLSSAAVQSDTLFVALSVLSVIFYLALLYNASWDEGGHERIKIDGGRAEWRPLRGLYVSLIANLPNLLIAVLILIGKIFGSTSTFGFEWAGGLYGIAHGIAIFYEGMYAGLVSSYSPYNPIGYFLIILPALLVCTVGYIIGVNNLRIVDFLTGKYFKNRKKDR